MHAEAGGPGPGGAIPKGGAGQLVFGYGSLAAWGGFTPRRDADPRGRLCDLIGYRRRFGVAMDNSRTIPGYKYYVEGTGLRPAVHVAFLDLDEAPGAAINGVCFPVSPAELAALDARERNYRRVEVTEAIRPRPSLPTWTFIGSESARDRCRAALANESLVVAGEYLRLVESRFEALGSEEAARYRASTAPPPCPVAELKRVEVPPSRPAPGNGG